MIKKKKKKLDTFNNHFPSKESQNVPDSTSWATKHLNIKN